VRRLAARFEAASADVPGEIVDFVRKRLQD
jgi:hypothetical protein